MPACPAQRAAVPSSREVKEEHMDHLRRGLAGTHRWKGCWAALAAATVLGLAVPAGTQTVLFTDDFEDGNANGWTVFGGSWSVVIDGTRVYRQSSGSSKYRSGAGSSAWTDYSVEASNLKGEGTKEKGRQP
jgi:hypothetical protein